MVFRDRKDAGRRLAQALKHYRGREAVVYALPRGGVIVGAEVARALEAPLDLIIACKIGHPLSPEYAVAAVGESGGLVCNPYEKSLLGSPWLQSQAESKKREARWRRELYLSGRAPLAAAGAAAILVDDGIATGLTMLAAIQELKLRRPRRIAAAIPVAPSDTAERLRTQVDELVSVDIPVRYLGAVSAYYLSFPQVSDSEVIEILEALGKRGPGCLARVNS